MKFISKRVILSLMVLAVFTISFFPVKASTTYYPMKVSYIDVGESDSVLIQSDGKSMLIDAGDTDDKEEILSYLKENKIKKLDYLILTHPHADHISCADDIIKTYKIDKVIMPKNGNNTKAYEDILTAIKKEGLKITRPLVGDTYTIGKASFTIVAPNNYDYGNNLNNYSIALKLVNGKNSFLFLGDCETEAIEDILANKMDINSDVYMCGHHGSKTSTTSELLKAVSPDYAVISVGKNSYGHPSDDTLQLLAGRGIKTYRTDKSGTIVATSTGTKITFDAKTFEITKNTTSTNANKVVYTTKSGKKYHLAGCSSLRRSKIKTTVKDAKADGYTPCSNCNPPK